MTMAMIMVLGTGATAFAEEKPPLGELSSDEPIETSVDLGGIVCDECNAEPCGCPVDGVGGDGSVGEPEYGLPDVSQKEPPAVSDAVIMSGDTTPPVINAATILTPSLSAPGTFRLSMDITEDVGVSQISLVFKHTLTNGATASKSASWHLYDGTGKQPLRTGIHTVEFELDEKFPATDYTLYYIDLHDTSGNYTQYDSGHDYMGEDPGRLYDYFNRGQPGNYSFQFDGAVQITSSSSADITAPVINAATVITNSLSAPSILRVSLNITEDVGVSQISMIAAQTLANGAKINRSLSWHIYDGVKQPLTTGVHELLFSVDPTFAAGSYEIYYIDLHDTSGNYTQYDSGHDYMGEDPGRLYDYFNRGQLGNYSFPFNGSFTVTNSLNIDLYAANGTDGLAARIAAMPDGGVAVIDYKYNSVAGADLFRAIAGQNRTIIFQNDAFQWVFDGLDVDLEKCKDINLDVNVWNVYGINYGYSDEETVTAIVFAGNGELPGKTDVRVYTEYMLARHGISLGEIFFTLINDGEALSETLPAAIAGDNYITFQITNNSTYVLSTTFPDKSINSPPVGGTRPPGGGTQQPGAKAPSAVSGLKATRGNKRVVLNWTAPNNGGSAIIRYQISQRTGNGSWGKWSNISGLGTSHTVTGLKNGTSYSFQIRAVNAIGNGGASKAASATPRATAPLAVDGLRVNAVGNKRVTLRWTAPNNGGSSITRYQYRQRTVGGKWGSWKTLSGKGTSRNVTGLTNGRNYEFQIRAINSIGNGAASNITAPVTLVAVPAEIKNLKATVGNGQARLRWKAPNNGGSAILRYEMRQRVGNGSWGGWTVLPGLGVDQTITGLRNGTSYRFQVRAVSAIGNAKASNIVTAKLPRRVPAAIADLSVAATGDKQVTLNWTAPDNGGAAISRYQVRQQAAGGKWTTWRTLSGSGTSRNVTDLTNDVTYTFQVRAVNSIGNARTSNDAVAMP